jgi:hypothetical protein
VACRRRAEAQQILAAKFVERAQQVMPIPQPAGTRWLTAARLRDF